MLEKVTLIKDIDYNNPHRAHQEILFDLSLSQLYKNHKFTNFVELHRAWQKTLDSTELNKQFFQEVSDWYFWAREKVRFPEDAPKDEEGLDSASLIRLITRLIFVWFLKEKRANATSLVPEEFFQEAALKELMQFDDANATTYYKAILQNLFFATLNQEMNTAAKSDNRKFRGKSKSGGRDAHYMTHNVYRYEALFKEPQRALELFEGVPFLNGDCLNVWTDGIPMILRRFCGWMGLAIAPIIPYRSPIISFSRKNKLWISAKSMALRKRKSVKCED